MRTKPGLVRFLFTQNPFYLIGTALLLYGLQITTDSGTLLADQPLFLAGVLAGVILAMAFIAIAIIRLGGVWDDARTILLSILLLCVGVVTSCDGALLTQPETAYFILGGGFLFCVGIWEMLSRCLGIWFPADVRVPFYAILGLIFFYSIVFAPAEFGFPAISKLTASWKLYGFGWLLSLAMLMCLPAIWQGRDLFRQTGTPWSWPFYPWSIFVILIGAACLRLYLLSLAFFPGHGWTSPVGIHFLMPVGIAMSVLIVESLLAYWNGTPKADREKETGLNEPPVGFVFSFFALLVLILVGAQSHEGMQGHFVRELTLSFASPYWISLILLLGYGGLLCVRGYRIVTPISVLLMLAAFSHPNQLGLSPALLSVWPLLLLGGLQVWVAIRNRSLIRWQCLAAAASVIVFMLLVDRNWCLAAFTSSQFLWGSLLLIGLTFRGAAATWTRLLAVLLMLGCSLSSTLAVFLVPISGLIVFGYFVALQAIIVSVWISFRWPPLIRIPILLMPCQFICLFGEQRLGITQMIREQAGVFLVVAFASFVVAVLISAFKAGWLNSIIEDLVETCKTVQLELSRAPQRCSAEIQDVNGFE